MPIHDPEPDDPHVLVGVDLPGDEAGTRAMAEAFADEFAQMGFDAGRIVGLFRSAQYAGPHRAWRLLGDREIARIVSEHVAFWGRFRTRIVEPESPPQTVQSVRFLSHRDRPDSPLRDRPDQM